MASQIVLALLFRLTLVLFMLPLLGIIQTEAIMIDVPPNILPRMQDAITDCVALATFASFIIDPCDDVYQRYFPPSDVDFVRRMFRRIANLPLDGPLPMDQLDTVMAQRATIGLDPRFYNLIIYFGNHPLGKEHHCDDVRVEVHGFFTNLTTGGGCLCMCEEGFDKYPDFAEIINPPYWARDTQGNPMPGWGCDGLGDHDSDLMWFPGVIMLHELLHYSELFNDVPHFWDYTYVYDDEQSIWDFRGPVPPDGYGAWGARVLNYLSTVKPNDYRPHEAINNADSYAAYAVSVWWRWKCQRTFKASVSAADNDNRDHPPRPPTPL